MAANKISDLGSHKTVDYSLGEVGHYLTFCILLAHVK